LDWKIEPQTSNANEKKFSNVSLDMISVDGIGFASWLCRCPLFCGYF